MKRAYSLNTTELAISAKLTKDENSHACSTCLSGRQGRPSINYLRMKKSLYSIIGLFVHIGLYAQSSDFIPGFIIGINNDTTYGFISYAPSSVNSNIIYFKKEYNKWRTFYTYSTKDIKGFYLKNRGTYKAFTVVVDKDVHIDIFAEIIYRGKYNLLRHKNQYIIEFSDSVFAQLYKYNIVVHDEQNDIAVIRTIYPYTERLYQYMGDCPGFEERIKNMVLDKKHIHKLYKDYHVCKGASFSKEYMKRPWYDVNAGSMVGLVFPSLRFFTNELRINYLSTVNWSPSTPLYHGIYTNFNLPHLSYNLMLHTELSFIYYDWHSNTPSSFNLSYSDNFAVQYSSLRLPVGFNHYLSDARISPVVNFGVVSCFNYNANVSYKQISKTGQEHDFQIPFSIRKYQVGLWVEGGVHYKYSHRLNIFSRLRYETLGQLTDKHLYGADIISKNSLFIFMVGINFK